MKRSALLAGCLIVMLLLQAAAAAAVPSEAKQLMTQYAEAWKQVEEGDYRGFDVLRRQLDAATQQFAERNPGDAHLEDFRYLRQLYADLGEIWGLRVEEGVRFLPKTGEQGKARGTGRLFMHTVMLRMNYPAVLNASLESKEDGYFLNSVLDNLMAHADAATAALAEKID
ncbi:MAG: hypothetical protein E6X17_10640 [Sporomusaceae bacterium]|nr:hypothetical protein [Sporomusaceae bacterium]